jgi:hypothetical protein
MSFFAINGYDIPVSANENPSYEKQIIGEKLGSYSGMLVSSVQNYRRRWKIRTTPLNLIEAHSLRNLIVGKGHNWSFDNTLYSGKNLPGAFTRNSVRYLLDGTSISSGDPGYEDGPNIDTNSSDGAIWIEVGTTPLTGSNTFLDTDGGGGIANGYTAYAAGTGAGSRSIDAEITTFGRSGSQKIQKTDGGSDAFGIVSSDYITSATAPNMSQYMVYVSSLDSGGQVNLRTYYYDATDVQLGYRTVYIYSATSGFDTYEPSTTVTNSNIAKIKIQIWISGNNGTIYVQGAQSENYAYCTSWTDVTRNNETVKIDASIFNRRNFTLGFWFKPLNNQIVSDKYTSLFKAHIDTDNYWQMVVGPDGVPYFAIKGRGSEVNTYDSSDIALTRGTWYFLAVHGDNTSFTMTINGAETTKGETGFGYRVPYGSVTYLYLGSNHDTYSQPGGVYSDLLVLPYRASTSQLLNYYNLNRSFYNLPRLEIYGNYIKRNQNNPIIAEGIFNHMRCVQLACGLYYVLDFDLIEII